MRGVGEGRGRYNDEGADDGNNDCGVDDVGKRKLPSQQAVSGLPLQIQIGLSNFAHNNVITANCYCQRQ